LKRRLGSNSNDMDKLVTIGIPIYKRLEFLPNALRVVAAQDYPHIDLLVSDNGVNGTAVSDLVDRHYARPYRFRQNEATVSPSTHFTQLIQHARGEYFVALPDDDEITPNFVSELLRVIERHPEVSAAFGREEAIDPAGRVIRQSVDTIPEVLSGFDFIKTTWGTREYRLGSFCTYLARTETLLACGGFPDIWAGTSDEDLLAVKLTLDSAVAFSTRCSYRKRVYETSLGYSITTKDLARGIREFVSCLDADPRVRGYAAEHPLEWKELRGYLVTSAWNTYYFRWADLYRRRLSPVKWAAAGFALPLRYHRRVARFILGAGKSAMLGHAQRAFRS
jgi:glycosyltransferase involved in cell wall biosynthesis